MTNKIIALTAAVATLGALPAAAQSYRTQWSPGLEQQERTTTRQLNIEQATQPTQYYYPPQPSYVPPPQYSYAPQYSAPQYSYAPQYSVPQHSYAPQPTYAYPYDYPPRPWVPRY